MARKKLVTDDTDIKEMAKKVARASILEYSQQDEEGPDDESLGFLDSRAEASNERAEDDVTGFDIFTDIGDLRTEKGDIVKYVLKKSGQHIATKFHPYSWEECLEEYGPGQYQAIARSESSKKYIKAESRILGDPRKAGYNRYHEEKEKETPTVLPQNNGLSFMEYWQLLQDQNRAAKEEAREAAKETMATQNQMMMVVAELMKANGSNGANSQVQTMQMITQMIQAQQENTNRIFEKLADSQSKMFEKINDRIEKVSEKKSTEFDMFNKGFEMFSKMNELAEKKAQLQLEMLEEAKEEARESGGDTEAPKKKSVTDSLIEGILPVVSQALINNQNAQAQGQHRLALQHEANKRRQLQIAQARRNQINGQVQPRTGVKTTGVSNTFETRDAKEKEGLKSGGFQGGTNVGETLLRKNGLPSINIGANVQPKVITPEIIDFSNDETETGIDMTVNEKCHEILPEFLGGLMLNNVEPLEAAPLTISFLEKNEITVLEFLKNVTSENLIEVAKSFGLPDEANEWLNELYANIQTSTRATTGRESNRSQQPTA